VSDYTQSTFFAPKDLLATGNPNKIIYGSDVDAELSAISTAIATKADVNGDAIGAGTPCTELSVDNLKLDGNKIISTDTDGDIELEPDGTGIVTIASDVGIGTTSPNSYASNRLHLNGASTSIALRLTNTTTGTTVDDGSDIEVSGSDLNIINRESANTVFFTGNAERVRIDSSGNVGYNGKLFSSNDLTTLGGLQLYRDHATGSCYLFDTTAAPFSGPLIFGTNNAEAMRIDSSGQVSVTSSGGLVEDAVGVFLLPSGELRVKDSTEDGTPQISIYNNNVISDAEQFFVGNNLADVDIGNKRGALKFFANSATERMRIDTSGNLGVGTQSPARKLHVNDVMRLEPRATAPSSPSAGDIFFNSSTNKLQCYDGTAWQDCF
jgi:hypothetical protein